MELNGSDTKTSYSIEDIEPDGSDDFLRRRKIFSIRR